MSLSHLIDTDCWAHANCVVQFFMKRLLSMATVTGGSCHKYHFCHDKSFVVKKDMFVVTKLLLWQIFVTTKHLLSWQKYACRDKTFCHDKHVFVATNMCHNKNYTCGSSHQWYATTFFVVKTFHIIPLYVVYSVCMIYVVHALYTADQSLDLHIFIILRWHCVAHRMSIFYPSNKVEGEGGSILTGISTCLSIHPSVCQCVHLQGHLKLIECLSVLCCVFCTTDNMFETKLGIWMYY